MPVLTFDDLEEKASKGALTFDDIEPDRPIPSMTSSLTVPKAIEMLSRAASTPPAAALTKLISPKAGEAYERFLQKPLPPVEWLYKNVSLHPLYSAGANYLAAKEGKAGEIGKAAVGAIEGLDEVTDFFRSPQGIALGIAGGLPPAAQRAVSAGFALQMASQLPEDYKGLVKSVRSGDTKEISKSLTKGLSTLAMTGAAGAHAALGPRARVPVRTGMTPEEAAANRAAVNLASPGTMRPGEMRAFAPPAPEAPPEMVTAELPPKFSQVVGKRPVEFLEPPEPFPEPEPPPKVQAETRGKVSFGAEAPTLLRESISPREELPAEVKPAEPSPQPAAPSKALRPAFRFSDTGEMVVGEIGQVHPTLFEKLPSDWKQRQIENGFVDAAGNFVRENIIVKQGGGLEPTFDENKPAAVEAAEPKGEPYASRVETPTEVHGDVRSLAGEGEGKVPVKEGGEGVLAPTEQRVPPPEKATEVLLKEPPAVEPAAEPLLDMLGEKHDLTLQQAQMVLDAFGTLPENANPEALQKAYLRLALPADIPKEVGLGKVASIKGAKEVLNDLREASAGGKELTKGKVFEVVWADGRAVQYFDNLKAAQDFAAQPDRDASPIRMVDKPKGARVKSEAPTPEPPAPKPKEAWEMTKQEFLDSILSKEGQRQRKKSVGNLTLKQWREQEHVAAVGQALQEGKTVPPEVLKDYPDLQKPQPPAAPSTTEEGGGKASEIKPVKGLSIKRYNGYGFIDPNQRWQVMRGDKIVAEYETSTQGAAQAAFRATFGREPNELELQQSIDAISSIRSGRGYQKAFETQAKKLILERFKQPPPAAPAEGGKPGLISGTAAEKWADERINEQRKRTSIGLDPEFFAAATIKGAAVIERGIRDFGAWSNEMRKLYGPAIEARLKDLYDSAVNHYNNARASVDSMFVVNKSPQDKPAGVLAPSTGQIIRSKLGLNVPVSEMAKEGKSLWRGFTMQALPRITMENREAGEAGVRYAAANQVARAKGLQFAHDVIASTGVDPVKFGIALSEDNLRDVHDRSLRNVKFLTEQGNLKEAAKWQAQADASYSFIGKEGSPFRTEQEWLAYLDDPKVKQAIEKHKQLWAEQKDPLFRQANDLTSDLPLASRGQRTGARVNLMGLTPEMEQELGTGQGVPGISSPLTRQLATLRRRDPFSRRATGAGERYEGNYYEIMANGFAREYPVAMQHEFIRRLVNSGLAKVVDKGNPKYLLKLKGWKGKFLQFDRPDIAGEYEDAVGLRPSAKLPLFTKAGEFLTKMSITGLAEGTTHASNLSLTAFTGLGPTSNPIANALLKSLGRIDLLYTIPRMIIKGLGNHESDMLRLAEIGAAKQPYHGPVSRHLLNPMDRGVRLVMADIYRDMAKKGIVPDTETGLREFVNESGNYNKRLQPWIIRTLRTTQIQPFATAVHTWNVQGARRLAMSTSAKATSTLANLALKADVAGGWIGAGVLLATLNFLLNKNDGRPLKQQVFGPPGTPLGAVGWTGDDKKTHYWHLARWLGYERGLRITGIGPVIEAKMQGLSGAQALTKGSQSVASTFLGYVGGPAVRAGTIGFTGYRPAIPPVREAPVAPPVADFNLFKNQMAYNIATALQEVSPVSDSAVRLIRGDPWEDAVTRQLSRYSPRTGMHPEFAEKLPEILERADVNEYIKDVARRGRRMDEAKRDAFFDEALNNIEDPNLRRKARRLFRLVSKE